MTRDTGPGSVDPNPERPTSSAPRSTGEMMSDLFGNIGNLVRNEADLARAEIAQSFGKAGASLALMGFALVLAITGLNLIAAWFVTLAILAGIPPHWAPLAVGGVVLLAALILFTVAKSAFQRIGFVPVRAARNLQGDASAIKDTFHDT